MKYTALYVCLLFICSPAFSAEKDEKPCDQASVKKIIGSTGSCSEMIVPRKTDKAGSCTGFLYGDNNTFKIEVLYKREDSVTSINVKSTESPGELVIEEVLDAEMFAFNRSLRLTDWRGKKDLITDPVEYIQISSELLHVFSEELIYEGKKRTRSSILLVFPDGLIPLSDVICN